MQKPGQKYQIKFRNPSLNIISTTYGSAENNEPKKKIIKINEIPLGEFLSNFYDISPKDLSNNPEVPMALEWKPAARLVKYFKCWAYLFEFSFFTSLLVLFYTDIHTLRTSLLILLGTIYIFEGMSDLVSFFFIGRNRFLSIRKIKLSNMIGWFSLGINLIFISIKKYQFKKWYWSPFLFPLITPFFMFILYLNYLVSTFYWSILNKRKNKVCHYYGIKILTLVSLIIFFLFLMINLLEETHSTEELSPFFKQLRIEEVFPFMNQFYVPIAILIPLIVSQSSILYIHYQIFYNISLDSLSLYKLIYQFIWIMMTTILMILSSMYVYFSKYISQLWNSLYLFGILGSLVRIIGRCYQPGRYDYGIFSD
jgi:hypothetical protein